MPVAGVPAHMCVDGSQVWLHLLQLVHAMFVQVGSEDANKPPQTAAPPATPKPATTTTAMPKTVNPIKSTPASSAKPVPANATSVPATQWTPHPAKSTVMPSTTTTSTTTTTTTTATTTTTTRKPTTPAGMSGIHFWFVFFSHNKKLGWGRDANFDLRWRWLGLNSCKQHLASVVLCGFGSWEEK